MMVNRRRLDVRIVDFSLVQKVTKEGKVVSREGNPEFMAPEVVVKDRSHTFLLLSGESPYEGKDKETAFTNIAYNRYNALSLYENITKEALKFIFRILKRVSRKIQINILTVNLIIEEGGGQGLRDGVSGQKVRG